MQGVAAEPFSVRHEVQLEVWWKKACQVTAAPRTTSIFMFGACLGPIPSAFHSLCGSRNTKSVQRGREPERERGIKRRKRRRKRAQTCRLFIRRFSLRSIRVHSPWIQRRAVTPALSLPPSSYLSFSDRPHCFNLLPKHRHRRRRCPSFLSLSLRAFSTIQLTLSLSCRRSRRPRRRRRRTANHELFPWDTIGGFWLETSVAGKDAACCPPRRLITSPFGN